MVEHSTMTFRWKAERSFIAPEVKRPPHSATSCTWGQDTSKVGVWEVAYVQRWSGDGWAPQASWGIGYSEYSLCLSLSTWYHWPWRGWGVCLAVLQSGDLVREVVGVGLGKLLRKKKEKKRKGTVFTHDFNPESRQRLWNINSVTPSWRKCWSWNLWELSCLCSFWLSVLHTCGGIKTLRDEGGISILFSFWI